MSEHPTVHVMAGLPASGKTTWARMLDAMRFCLDDYRAMMGFGSGSADWTREKENIAIRAMLDGALVAIRAGCDIVLDNTHLVPRLPRMYRKEFGPFGVKFVVHDLTDVSIAECLRRDGSREDAVGEDVIDKLAGAMMNARKGGWRLTAEWMTPTQAEPLVPYAPRPLDPLAVIVDIDGTVALHGDERGHYEYEKVASDKPNWPIINLVAHLHVQHEILFVSGREDRCRVDTEEWIHHYLGFAGTTLFMRTTGDHRPDYIIKAELFDAHIRDGYNVVLVLDDRDQTVRMWRSLGLTCLQVAEGKF